MRAGISPDEVPDTPMTAPDDVRPLAAAVRATLDRGDFAAVPPLRLADRVALRVEVLAGLALADVDYLLELGEAGELVALERWALVAEQLRIVCLIARRGDTSRRRT